MADKRKKKAGHKKKVSGDKSVTPWKEGVNSINDVVVPSLLLIYLGQF